MALNRPIEVGILGGTGMVGQHFISFLQGHPWFQLTWLGASDRSAGKKLKDATSWRLEGEMPASPGATMMSHRATPRIVDNRRSRPVTRRGSARSSTII